MVTVASVQARMGSTRLPGKVLLHLGRARILERVVEASGDASAIDRVAVTTGNDPANQAIEQWCDRAGIDCLAGPEEDLLSRHLAVAREFDADRLVRVTGDCPFVPPEEIDRLLTVHSEGSAKYTTNHSPEMPIGTAVDVLAPAVLEELSELGETHPVRLLRSERDEFDVAVSPNPAWSPYATAHLAVDTPQDYWELVDAILEVGEHPLDIAEFLVRE